MELEAHTTASLPQALALSVAHHGAHSAINFAGRSLTLAEVDALSGQVAAGLAARGVIPGDHVALYCVNSDAFALAYLGIVKAGATVVPINLLLNPKEIEYILNDATVTALIYHEALTPNVSAFRAQVPGLRLAICIGAARSDESDLPWEAVLDASVPLPAPAVDANADVASILYTSGTTGKPKGAMLTHRNLVFDALAAGQALRLRPGEDVILTVLPMFHSFAATVGMLTPLLAGCTFLPVPKFEPRLVTDTITAGKATVFLGVPSMYNVLLNLADEDVAGWSGIRYGVSGGAAMPQELMKRFEDRFGFPIYEGDGPTECAPVTCVNPIDGRRQPASVGLPIPGVEMRIVDDAGETLPDNAHGEICVRGPNVMKGYWQRPEETAGAFYGEWFRTGDLGYRDADGYFYIVDRIKDLIIVNGMNVYPRVVEEVLYQHPDITEAAVVGEPHELHGEIPVAFVALREGTDLAGSDVRAFCREQLGQHEVPRKVIFLETLPKNAAGKILKRELRVHGELERGVPPGGS